MGSSQPVALRHNRDFRLLWFGQAVSVLGTNISAVAYPLLVLAAGLLLDRVGSKTTILLLGGLMFAIAIASVLDPSVRQAPPLD